MRRFLMAAAALSLACHDGSGPEGTQLRGLTSEFTRACASRGDGTLRCWGMVPAELFGGDSVALAPTRQAASPELATFDAYPNQGGCGLDAVGRAWCWGRNEYGQAGRAEGVGRPDARQPVLPVETDLRFRAIATNGYTTCAIAKDGRLHCWGNSHLLGVNVPDLSSCFADFDAEVRCTPRPVPVPLPATALEIAMVQEFACVRTADRVIRCWGFNGDGRLGVGITDADWVETPTPLVGDRRYESLSIGEAIESGLPPGVSSGCGDVAGDGVWCWPGAAPGGDPERVSSPDGVEFASVTVGGRHRCALDTDGRAWCWGWNGRWGALGNGSTDPSEQPVRVLGDLRFRTLAAGDGFTCGEADDGTWCWGRNDLGQVGNGTTVHQPIPTLVAGQRLDD